MGFFVNFAKGPLKIDLSVRYGKILYKNLMNDVEELIMTEKKEQKWIKPQLVVIGRGKPEESVLAACKNAGLTPLKPDTDCRESGSTAACSGVGQS